MNASQVPRLDQIKSLHQLSQLSTCDAIIIKGLGIFLGIALLSLGGFIGIEDLLAPGTINIPILVFSLGAILGGSIMLWLAFKKKENT